MGSSLKLLLVAEGKAHVCESRDVIVTSSWCRLLCRYLSAFMFARPTSTTHRVILACFLQAAGRLMSGWRKRPLQPVVRCAPVSDAKIRHSPWTNFQSAAAPQRALFRKRNYTFSESSCAYRRELYPMPPFFRTGTCLAVESTSLGKSAQRVDCLVYTICRILRPLEGVPSYPDDDQQPSQHAVQRHMPAPSVRRVFEPCILARFLAGRPLGLARLVTLVPRLASLAATPSNFRMCFGFDH